jgi:hypothetical protein
MLQKWTVVYRLLASAAIRTGAIFVAVSVAAAAAAVDGSATHRHRKTE